MNERRFFSHFRGEERAVNVYKLIDGTYTEADGIDPSLIDVVYRGSTRTEVTAEEATLLVAAGYEVEGL